MSLPTSKATRGHSAQERAFAHPTSWVSRRITDMAIKMRAELSRDHNGNLADCSAGLACTMGVCKLVKRVRGGQLCYHLFFGDPLHQRRKAPLGRKITHEPVDEPVPSAHPAKRETSARSPDPR